jgi:hypothetical protein
MGHTGVIGPVAKAAGWRRAKLCGFATLAPLLLFLLTRAWKYGSLSWLTYGDRRQRVQEGDSKAAPQKMQNRKEMQKDTKIDGTNSRIYCKQGTYSYFE